MNFFFLNGLTLNGPTVLALLPRQGITVALDVEDFLTVDPAFTIKVEANG